MLPASRALLFVILCSVASIAHAITDIRFPTPLPEAQVGHAYSFTFVPVGVQGSLFWGISPDGCLPADSGLALQGSQLVGTPTVSAVYNCQISATDIQLDAQPTSVSKAFTLVVLALPFPPTIAKSFGAVTMTVGESTSLGFTIDNSNKSTTLTGVGFADTLPDGLVVSSPSGLAGSCGGGTIVASPGSGVVSLSGAAIAPSSSCAFSVNVTGTTASTKNNTTSPVTSVEAGSGGTASASIRVTAVPAPPRCVSPTITSAQLPPALVGVPYAFTIAASGDPPLVLSVSGLPPGLAFDVASGKVSGVPTGAGTSTVTITASNGCQPSAVRTQTLTVARSASTLSISASPNPVYFGQAVVVIVRASGGRSTPQGVVLLCARQVNAFCPPPFDSAPPGTPASGIRAPLSAPLDANGQASFTLTGLLIDNYIFKASYGGDAAHDGGSAGPMDEFVIKGVLLAPPKVALVAPLRATSGAPLSIGVRVTPVSPAPTPTGTVLLYAGADLVGSAALDAHGSAQFTIAPATSGPLPLLADYLGDSLFPPASSPQSVLTIAAVDLAVEVPAVGPTGLALLALALAALGLRPLYRRARRP